MAPSFPNTDGAGANASSVALLVAAFDASCDDHARAGAARERLAGR